MRITAQEEYGLRCILHIARRSSQDPVNIQDIASSEGLSKQYVAKLLHQLQRAGLINSCRGIHGGYRLTSPADQMAVSQVIEAMGGLFTSRSHRTKGICETFVGNQARCVHSANCGVRPLWDFIARHVTQVLRQLTLANLLAEESTSATVIEGYFRKEFTDVHPTLPDRESACECREQTDPQGCHAHHSAR